MSHKQYYHLEMFEISTLSIVAEFHTDILFEYKAICQLFSPSWFVCSIALQACKHDWISLSLIVWKFKGEEMLWKEWVCSSINCQHANKSNPKLSIQLFFLVENFTLPQVSLVSLGHGLEQGPPFPNCSLDKKGVAHSEATAETTWHLFALL